MTGNEATLHSVRLLLFFLKRRVRMPPGLLLRDAGLIASGEYIYYDSCTNKARKGGD